jgi:DtxR family transcriptional regulator, Mn-dependent transcriptional regulator
LVEFVESLQRLTRRQLETLESIQSLETELRGAPLKSIASSMGLRAPSALGHVTPLEAEGLVVRHRGKSRLTDKGRRTLLEYRRHHRVAESLFSNVGLTPSEVCRAAQEVDLALSHSTIEKLCAAEGHPAVCPHGEPITPCSVRRAAGGAS